MKTVIKFTLIMFGGFVLVIVLVFAGLWFAVDAKYGKAIEEKIVEGDAFAKTTDKNGCFEEGLKRARSIGSNPNLIDPTLNKSFVMSCFESTPKNEEFCKTAPALRDELRIADEYDRYAARSCRKRGFGERHEACEMVMAAKEEFCRTGR